MGLYLCVFDSDEELDGIEVGSYGDFNSFRSAVVERLESGKVGKKYPTLILHSDCDGQWTPEQCVRLENELREIARAFQTMPPREFNSAWQKNVAEELGFRPQNLYESFIDVDGQPLIARLSTLCRLAFDRKQPILFQ